MPKLFMSARIFAVEGIVEHIRDIASDILPLLLTLRKPYPQVLIQILLINTYI